MEKVKVINWTKTKVKLTLMETDEGTGKVRILTSEEVEPVAAPKFPSYDELLDEGTIVVMNGDTLAKLLMRSIFWTLDLLQKKKGGD